MNRLLLIFLVCLTTGHLYANEELKGKVVEVLDGNTIQVQDSENETYKIKLLAIDCPEIDQKYGEEAKKYTSKRALHKHVVVKLFGKDRKGNRLGVVVLPNDKILNELLLKDGFAWHYKMNHEKAKFSNLETDAKHHKKGLWAEESPTPPWIFRRQRSMMVAKSR